MKDPIAWVQALIHKQDLRTAFVIVEFNAQSHFGKGTQGEVKNNHASYYRNALAWLRKRHKKPESAA